MPNMIKNLVSLETSVNNDIYYSVMEDISHILKLDPATNKILHNSMETGKTDTRNTATKNSDNNTPTTTAMKRLIVRVETEQDADTTGSNIININNNFPIFRDTEIGVNVAPIYHRYNLTFNCLYRSPSKVDVENIRSIISNMLSTGTQLYNHDVTYTMILPDFTRDFISDVHELKNRLYPIPFDNYLFGYSNNRVHYLTDMSNIENAMLGVRELQQRVIGEFDFVAIPPTRDTDNSKGQYTLAFGYKIQMELPRSLVHNFPIVICNRMMKDAYIEPIEKSLMIKDKERRVRNLNMGRGDYLLNTIPTSTIQIESDPCVYPINLPIFDNYKPIGDIIGFGCVATLLPEVNEDDKKSLFNLRDLDDWYFSDHTLDYISKNREKVTTIYGSFIYIGLEQQGKYYSASELVIDEDLNLSSKTEIDLKVPVRVTVWVCSDINYLNEDLLREISKDDALFLTFLSDYIEYRNTFTPLNNRIESRDNKLSRILINKIDALLSMGAIDKARLIIEIVEQDDISSWEVGYLLTHAYVELTRYLLIVGVCYVKRDGRVGLLSLNKKERERQVREHTTTVEFTRELFTYNNEYSWEHRSEARYKIKQTLQKTVMFNSLFINNRRVDNGTNEKEFG